MRSRFVQFTAPLQVEVAERDVPAPAEGQALVRTVRSLISTGTELTILRGGHCSGSLWEAYGRFPCSVGYCNVGVAEAVGPGCRHVRVGDRVASEGPHAERFVVAEADLRAVPSGVSDDEALFATIAEIVMHGVRLSAPVLGDAAVVCGLGLLGQLTLTFARFCGAWPVVGVDHMPFRCEAATRRGAAAAGSPADALRLVAEHTDGRMADIAYEVTGNPEAIAPLILLLRRQGRLMLVSSPRGPSTLDFHDMVNARGTVIVGAHNFTHASVPNEYNRWTRHADAALYLALVSAGQVSACDLLTATYPASEAPAAYRRLLDRPGDTLALALDWS